MKHSHQFFDPNIPINGTQTMFHRGYRPTNSFRYTGFPGQGIYSFPVVARSQRRRRPKPTNLYQTTQTKENQCTKGENTLDKTEISSDFHRESDLEGIRNDPSNGESEIHSRNTQDLMIQEIEEKLTEVKSILENTQLSSNDNVVLIKETKELLRSIRKIFNEDKTTLIETRELIQRERKYIDESLKTSIHTKQSFDKSKVLLDTTQKISNKLFVVLDEAKDTLDKNCEVSFKTQDELKKIQLTFDKNRIDLGDAKTTLDKNQRISYLNKILLEEIKTVSHNAIIILNEHRKILDESKTTLKENELIVLRNGRIMEEYRSISEKIENSLMEIDTNPVSTSNTPMNIEEQKVNYTPSQFTVLTALNLWQQDITIPYRNVRFDKIECWAWELGPEHVYGSVVLSQFETHVEIWVHCDEAGDENISSPIKIEICLYTTDPALSRNLGEWVLPIVPHRSWGNLKLVVPKVEAKSVPAIIQFRRVDNNLFSIYITHVIFQFIDGSGHNAET